MRAFLQICLLELRSAVRSWTLPLLTLAVVAWTLGLPHLLTGDGTAEGAYRLYVHYALGGAACLLAVSLAASAAGSLAKDRQAKRLAQTQVRPVPYFVLALGRWAALTLVGALVLALAAAAVACRAGVSPAHVLGAGAGGDACSTGLSRPCHHVLSPVFAQTPRQEAEAAYTAYLQDPAKSNNVAQVDRAVALDILTQRAEDRFDVVDPGGAVAWDFQAVPASATRLAVRLKFSNRLDTKGRFIGRLTLGPYSAAVSNVTESVIVVPLGRPAGGGAVTGPLRLENASQESVMLRPRKDVSLLYGNAGDTFLVNLGAAYACTLAMLSLIIAFALFLGACLSRSVAVFATLTLLLAAEVAPSLTRVNDETTALSAGDRIGLEITRVVEKVTRPIGSAHPIETLAEDECLEPGEVLRTAGAHLVLAPLLFAFLAGLVIPKKS